MTVQQHERKHTTGLPDSGLTLVEVIVAMVLLAIVALAMIPVLASGARSAANTREMSKAAQYVATEMERARYMECDDVNTNLAQNKFLSPVGYSGAADGVRRAYKFYTLRSTITDTPGGKCQSGHTYRLTVTATLDGGTTNPVTATTVILPPS